MLPLRNICKYKDIIMLEYTQVEHEITQKKLMDLEQVHSRVKKGRVLVWIGFHHNSSSYPSTRKRCCGYKTHQ